MGQERSYLETSALNAVQDALNAIVLISAKSVKLMLFLATLKKPVYAKTVSIWTKIKHASHVVRLVQPVSKLISVRAVLRG